MSNLITTAEDFENQVDKELAQFTGHILQSTYPGYLWGVRIVSKGIVGFTLGELMAFGEGHIMVVHPRDFAIRLEFEKIVKKLGGELLERARLNRGESKNVAVLQRPDGFNAKFDPTIKEHKVSLKDKF